jgi:hypothetical protein
VAADALRAVTGHRLALKYELREGNGGEDADALSGEELVRRFMDEFDAEEILEDGPEEGKA